MGPCRLLRAFGPQGGAIRHFSHLNGAMFQRARQPGKRVTQVAFADDADDTESAARLTEVASLTVPTMAGDSALAAAGSSSQQHTVARIVRDDLAVGSSSSSSSSEPAAVPSLLQADHYGNRTSVPLDAVQIVTDEFARIRKEEQERRQRLLGELLTPNPADYTYDGKLVPMPPLNFGVLSSTAYKLGHEMMVKPTYSLVRESPATDYFFEINDMYLEIVFVGRANAGKSSLINALTDQPVLAKTSSRPNSTRTVTFYQSASPAEMAKFANRNPSRLVKLPGGGLQFTFVDVPGFGIEGMTDKWRDNAISLTDSYLGVRRSVNTVFMCIDVRLGVTPTDLTYFEWLENLHGVFWVILTKCDAVSHARICKVMSDVYKLITSKANKRKYRRLYPFVLPVSAHAGTNIDTLRALIVETSGVLPGDALRKLLQRRRDELWAKLRDVDSERLACKAREEAAGREELYRRLLSGSPSDTYQHTSDIAEQPAAGRVPDGAADADFIVEPVEVTPPIEISGRASTQRSNRLSIPGAEASGFSFNTGMGPAPDVVPRDDTLEAVVGASLRPPPGLSASAPVAASEKPASAAPRKGLVSTYMDDADGFIRRGSRRDGQTTGRNGARAGGAARQQPGVYIAQSDGSLRRASGAVAPTAARAAPQSARERLSQLQRISPSAPWSQPLRRMTPAEREAYAKRSGGTSVVGAAAVVHVEEQMWRGETRAVSTLRKERELQHHANGRASRTMLPVGLWNQYGGAGKSTPGSVMGL